MMKAINIIKNSVFWLATVLVAVAIILVALPMLGHLEYKTIVSGSMEPEIPVGSLILISEIKDEDIRVGDTITFATTGDITVTHKVVGYDLSKNALITHGVANDEGNNEITPFEKVVGKVVFTIPFIGRLFLLISTMRGKIIAATVIAVLYIISVFFETLGSGKGADKNRDSSESVPEASREGLEPEPKPNKDSEEKSASLGSWLDNML